MIHAECCPLRVAERYSRFGSHEFHQRRSRAMNAADMIDLAKALHIAFVVCWFSGIFYLPRLFVNHAMTTEASVHAQLRQMERKLYRFMTPFAWLTVLLGTYLLLIGWNAYRHQGWMFVKLILVAVLIIYHMVCGHFVRQFARELNRHGHVFFRWFNELPVVILFSVILLVVLKPF
jgi:protoporphyrinogen IX oxidase